MKVWQNLFKGIIRENPVLVLLLGTCPTLAVTTSVSNAFGMGLAAMAVLIGSNFAISLLNLSATKNVGNCPICRLSAVGSAPI